MIRKIIAFAVFLLIVVVAIIREPLISYYAFVPDTTHYQAKDMPGHAKELYLQQEGLPDLHAWYFEKTAEEDRDIVLYFHGNAGNNYHRLDIAKALDAQGYDVLLLDYQGYGKSQGNPTESGIYEDAQRAYAFAKEEGYDDKNIIIMGRSIGSTAAIDLAQNKHVKALVLITPLSNGYEMALDMGMGLLAWGAWGSFDNTGKAENLLVPTLVIQGTEDYITPQAFAQRLYQVLPMEEKRYISVKGADHNGLIDFVGPDFWLWVDGFIQQEWPQKSGSE